MWAAQPVLSRHCVFSNDRWDSPVDEADKRILQPTNFLVRLQSTDPMNTHPHIGWAVLAALSYSIKNN